MSGNDSTRTGAPRRARPGGAVPRATSGDRGREAEDFAAVWLATQGLRTIARNVRYRGGEIDLVCRDGQALVFVEVRQRSSSHFGSAAESITPAKVARLVTAARLFLASQPELARLPARFDCVLLGPLPDPPVEWLRDAFRAD